MKQLYSLLTFIALFFSLTVSAQTGTEFWLAPPEVTSGHVTDNPIVLRMATGPTAATVTIEQPANGALFNGGAPIVVNIPANSATTVDLSAELNNLETRPVDVVLNTGLHVSSTTTITCYYEINTGFNPDIYALKGANALGTEFYTPFQNVWANGNYTPTAYTSFDIVATEDNTTVFIYPRVPLDGGHPALSSYSITLMRGQTYSGAVTGGAGIDNPAGTIITSDKPIAVSIKDDSVNPAPAGCRDLIGDQIVPTNIVGDEYIFSLGGLTVAERGYLTATQNATDVFVAGVYQTTLFNGETFGFDLTAASTYVNTSKPVYALHVSGFGCEVGGAILPPLACAGSDEVNFVRSTTEFFALNILVKAGNEGNFELNGNPALIPAGSFAAVPGTGGAWMSAQISYNTTDVPVGSNNLITNSTEVFAVGLINGGASSGCRFGYFSEFSAEIFTDAGVDQIVCANDTAQLAGSVSGGSTTGIWTSTGSGVFLPDDVTLNAEYVPSFTDIATGFVDLTLTSTGQCFPIADALTITFTPGPTVDAGIDQAACGNNPTVTLGGSVTIATGGVWTGGAGTFSPNNTDLNATYTPTAGEIAGGSLTLTLTTTGNGNCNIETDDMTITFGPAPTADAGVDQTICANNPDVTLAGVVTIATGGTWSGGAGTFTPNANTLNAVYTPTPAEITSGSVTLTLTTTGNGGCTAENDDMLITFTTAPTANAGVDQTLCENNADISLNGAVTVATGGAWSGGLGTFTPNNTTLNATYSPTVGEISSGSLTLTLTTTGNGNCLAVTDDVDITFTAAPTADAGVDQTVCGNNPDVTLAGGITIASGGIWTGGAGTFSPNNTTLNATYTPSAAEISAGTATLTLTTTGNGNCLSVSDDMEITITPAPTANAGVDQTVCANNADVTLAGSITVASGGVWSGGAGTFNPSNTALNAIYTPTAGEITSGSVTLTLTTTGNGTCNAVNDDMMITFTPAPMANAGIDQTLCSNNADISLNGSVTVATGGSWSGGLGTFTPNNTTLNATYTPTVGEISSGSLTLTLTTTGNGNCTAVTDDVDITFTAAPTADAGIDQTVCGNNPAVSLGGAITISSGGIWSGGAGTFSPNNTDLNAIYTPSGAEISAGTVTLTLTTTGNGTCNPETDDMTITITSSPTADAGVDQTVCANNADVTLSGGITVASGGIWSGGSGTFNPSNTALNAIYTPTAGEISSGSVTLTLTTTGNGTCNAVNDDMMITFTLAPSVNAGVDQTLCANNADVSLGGSVTIASGGIWTGGLGTFTPNNTDLNATYTPTLGEIASGSITLTLTSTGNGNCNAVADDIDITFTPAVTADAGTDIIVCGNNPTATLNGSVTIASGGIWSGGAGIFSPNNTTLNATYTPTAAEVSVGTVTLTLTTFGNGNCSPAVDDVVITIDPSPTADAGIDQSICENNPDVTLAGSVTIASGGVWSGGAGTFNPGNTALNAVYAPTPVEIASGSVTLTLTTTGNGLCNAVSDNMTITFTPAPTANAGVDQTLCANNADISLSGSVTGATGGSWSGGLGTFTPNNTDLNAVYSPTVAEIASGSLTLTLSTTGNGNCLAVTDDVDFTFTAAPTADAGTDQSVCENNADVVLAGVVTIASGGQWSGGAGTFSPNNNDLNATYTPTAAEIASGSLTLTLTTSGNGNCVSESDDIIITFTAAPTANAGVDQVACANNTGTVLNGSVTGASGGVWSGGAGTFNPSNTDMNATYTPSVAEIAAGSVTLTLTTTGNGTCLAVTDDMTVTITPAPTVSAGVDQTICENNADISLNGVITGAGGGQWGGGLGVFTPDPFTLNAVYTPTVGEIASGSINLTLTTTSNGACLAEVDDMDVTFTAAPIVDAGVDQSVCANNPDVNLAGLITTATGGQWSGGGGTFTPNILDLNATYTPTAAEITSGSVTLYLTSTGNGNCLAVVDSMLITITPVPTVTAGPDATSCANNSAVALAGIVGNAGGGIWSGGAGTFNPSNTDLNATYIPTAGEIAAGTVTLTLTTTGNGTCNALNDAMTITITPAPTVDAGIDQTVCENNADVSLGGVITGSAGGQWTGGLGTFAPSSTSLNAIYSPTAAEIASGSLTLTLTTTGNGSCNAELDNMTITFTGGPTVSAGVDQSICANNASATLAGSFTVASGIQWSGGLGTFNPSDTDPNAVYTPTAAEVAAGSVTLTATTTGNGTCLPESDDMVITIAPSPVVNAGGDQTVCVTDLNILLGGSVTGSTSTGQWSTTGNGFFTPSNNDLNATYQATSQDSINGGVTLILTSTNNGNCAPVIDSMQVFILPAGTASAGPDQTVCANLATVSLGGTIGGNASAGQWSTTGTGVFNPTPTDLNATYIPSPSDIAAGTITITLTANSCNLAQDDLILTITPEPVVTVGNDTTICVTNLSIPLNGSVTGASATGQWTTSGSGTFVPNNTTLNATYVASSADSIAQGVTLILEATNIGACLPASDTMQINIFPAGIADAGIDQTVCANNAVVTLNGQITGGATEGIWTTSGSGTFSPADTVLNATYTPSAADTAAGSVNLILTSTNSCNIASDFLVLTINPAPYVNAGADMTVCGSNPTASLGGVVSGVTFSGVWSTSGSGTFSPSPGDLNATYNASAADVSAGSVWLTLTSTVNGTCNPVSDSLQLTISTGIAVDAGPDQIVCSTSDSTQLQGNVSNGSSTGIWTTLGSGTFDPSDTDLNAWYNYSTADTAAGSVQLVLTSTNNGTCAAESDTMTIIFGGSVFADAGVDQTICAIDTSVTLAGFITGGSTTGVWTTTGTGGFTPSDTLMNATYLISPSDSVLGTVDIILTSTNNAGCVAGVDTMTITIDPIPSISAGPDQTVCSASDSVNMAGTVTNATGGVWTTLGTGTFTNDSIPNPLYAPSVADSILGGVTLVYTSYGTGTCATVADSMTVTFSGGNSASAGPDQTICGDNLIISLNGSVNGANGGVWTTSGSGTFTPSDTILNADYIASTADSIIGSVNLILSTTGNNGCPAGVDTVTITIDPVPAVDAGADVAICAGVDSVPLAGSVAGATGVQWTTSGTGVFVPNATTANATYAPSTVDAQLGSIELIITSTGNGSCPADSDTMMITFDNPLIADFGFGAACLGLPMQFSDSTQVLSGSIQTWAWNFGDAATSADQNPSHIYAATGTYTVWLVVTSDLGCMDSISYDLTVSDPPIADFMFNSTGFGVDEPVVFTDISTGASNWDWDFGDAGSSTDQNPSHSYAFEGTYTVTLIVSNTIGCADTASYDVGINAQEIFPPKVPTGFSPNGDGENDVFYVRGGPFEVLNFQIYNGWGELIFETDDPLEGWDGTHKGKQVPQGVYVITAKATTVDGNSYSKSGKVTLIR